MKVTISKNSFLLIAVIANLHHRSTLLQVLVGTDLESSVSEIVADQYTISFIAAQGWDRLAFWTTITSGAGAVAGVLLSQKRKGQDIGPVCASIICCALWGGASTGAPGVYVRFIHVFWKSCCFAGNQVSICHLFIDFQGILISLFPFCCTTLGLILSSFRAARGGASGAAPCVIGERLLIHVACHYEALPQKLHSW